MQQLDPVAQIRVDQHLDAQVQGSTRSASSRTSPNTSQNSRFACHFQEMSVWLDMIELKVKRSFLPNDPG